MSFKDLPGGEAFPSHPEAGVQRHFIARGMSLRDYFAAKAMQAELGDGVALSAMSMLAKRAYIMADAMLEARK